MDKITKEIKSLTWAKRNKDFFHDLFTNAGDAKGLSKERSLEDVDKPRVVTKKGASNFKKALKTFLGKKAGANVADQTVENLDSSDLMVIINNLAKAMKFKPMTGISASTLNIAVGQTVCVAASDEVNAHDASILRKSDKEITKLHNNCAHNVQLTNDELNRLKNLDDDAIAKELKPLLNDVKNANQATIKAVQKLKKALSKKYEVIPERSGNKSKLYVTWQK